MIKQPKKVKAGGTLECETIRREGRKDSPKNMKGGKQMAKGNLISNTGIYFKWKNNRFVMISSNFHGTERKCRQHNKEILEVLAPEIVEDHDTSMGLDSHDQLLQSSGLDQRLKKMMTPNLGMYDVYKFMCCFKKHQPHQPADFSEKSNTGFVLNVPL